MIPATLAHSLTHYLAATAKCTSGSHCDYRSTTVTTVHSCSKGKSKVTSPYWSVKIVTVFLRDMTCQTTRCLHTNIKALKKLSPSCFHDYVQPNAIVHRIGIHQAPEVASLVLLKILPCMVFKPLNILVLISQILLQPPTVLPPRLPLFVQI